MTTTTNYGMQLPSGSDPASITPINQNTNFLDGKLKELEDVTDSVIDEIDKTTSSVSGSVITITDSAPNSIAKSVVASIVPVQASGTPTPSSPLPISGFTGVTVTVEDDYDNPTEVETYTVSWQTEAGTVYGGYINPISGVLTVTHKGIDLGAFTWDVRSAKIVRTNLTDSADYISGSAAVNGLCSNYSVIAMASLADDTVAFNSATQFYVRDGSHTFTTAEEAKSYLAGVTLVYKLATPLTYQLTPQTIKLLENNNTIFSDTGDTSLTYVVSDKYSKGGIPTVEAVKQYVMEMLGL